MSTQDNKQYFKVLTIFQSQKQNGLYYYGVISIKKGEVAGNIIKVTVLNTFNELKSQKDMVLYIKKVKEILDIDKTVTNIESFSKDSIYYPTLTDAKKEHALAVGYKDVQSRISYPKGVLDHRNIKIDDSSDQIRYRFDFDNTKPIIYCICMAIHAVKKDKIRSVLKALSEE